MTDKTHRCLLLTFDAFSTLFHPRRPIPELYSSIASTFGLPTTSIAPHRLQEHFKNAYKNQNKAYPNYGREKVLRGEYGGPRQWWSSVIKTTFTDALESSQENVNLPDGLIETLLDTFASQQGYSLYEDVQPCFDRLRRYRTAQHYFDSVITGIISNSDDRVPAVLKSLGLLVGDTRADADRSSTQLPGFETSQDVDWQSLRNLGDGVQELCHTKFDLNMIITSYEAGEEKPSRLIFDVAARQAGRLLALTTDSVSMNNVAANNVEWTCVHVGDDFEKDYQGAIGAGWHGVFIDRDGAYSSETDQDVRVIRSLEELIPEIERYNNIT